MIRKSLWLGLLISTASFFVINGCKTGERAKSSTELVDQLITEGDVVRIETFLASDDLKGRKNFSPELEKAAEFIGNEFSAAGLEPLGINSSYMQEFALVRANPKSLKAVANGEQIDEKNVVVLSCQAALKISHTSGFKKAAIRNGDNLFTAARKFFLSGENMVIGVDPVFAGNFSGLGRLRSNMFKSQHNVVFILAKEIPETFEVEITQEITEQKLANVVGVLPGKSRKDEYVIFSAHYDHIGTGRPVNGDSIYNGANDDAAGVAAVIMLAKYFKGIGRQERTLVFAAFAAEEIGGYGSQYFSRQFQPEKVVAMINIEMIGTESKWGKNAAFITGYERSDLGAIMQKNLQNTSFEFHPDPYPAQQLFYRSDNATFARLGVPAHSVSTAKMDAEPHYHKVSDEVGTLDLGNMTMIIKAIALSVKGIVAGKETPSRVDVESLR